MGQEESVMIDESVPPTVLKERTIDAIADYIVNKPARNIVVMVGAGISTSSGIPDFRSPVNRPSRLR
ncbi:Sir2 histone deacetylase Hst2 [Ascosphaera acerosa]|nr:Sir2 histone deacetylase Hst2 [Ascosphaera acerosa]